MAADSWGVAFGFHDGAGTWHEAAEETRSAVRRALGAPTSPEVDPPNDGALVMTTGSVFHVDAPTTLHTESNAHIRLPKSSQIPSDLEIGYHTLVNDDDGSTRPLIVAPTHCTPFTGSKQWGWAVQMYALRSKRSWGIGEFRDLRSLNEWSREHGAGMTLVNPLHACAPTPHQQPSPYFPTSRCFRNPLALTIEEVPGYNDVASEIEPIGRTARELNASQRIDRNSIFAAKIDALSRMWERWRERAGEGERGDFDAYRTGEGRTLTDFATYCVIAEQYERGDWMTWPEALRDPKSEGAAKFRSAHSDRVRFHEWIQWTIDQQLGRCRAGLDLMTDLAIGVDRGGADAWMWQDSFALDMSVGAPPDAFNTQGQNWGLPPFDPWRLRRNGYEPFIRTVRSAFRHAQALRMDHVMGLFRLYWIPDGQPATNGCYVYLPFQDFLGIVAIESIRANAYVVGEDLGTVEPYVREELANRRILSYRLRQFETIPTAEFPEHAVAAITTHDLPTIPGIWTRSDVTTQEEMGMKPNRDGTEHIRTSIAGWAGVDPGDQTPVHDVVVGAYRDLATAPSVIVTATLDDALGVEERPNMPGTVDEWPNWRIPLPMPLEDILTDPRLADVAAQLRGR